jgi:non-homologous end joining protein Ku
LRSPRCPVLYEVRSEDEYFDDIQDVKVTKDMLDRAKHIVVQKTCEFEPEKFKDHYEAALAELINQKRSGKAITSKPRPKGENAPNDEAYILSKLDHRFHYIDEETLTTCALRFARNRWNVRRISAHGQRSPWVL